MSSFSIPAVSYNIYATSPGLGWSVKRTPRFKNIVQRSANDIRTAAGLSSYPVWTWEMPYEVLRSGSQLELQYQAGFFNGQHGQLTPFCFLDPLDNVATAAQFGTGDATSTLFQLFRTFGSFYEPVLAPYGTAQVFINAVEKAATTDFTISNTGLVTFTSAPANGAVLTWTGTFYWVCAFTMDETEFENFMNGLWTNKKITFESLKATSLA